MKSYEVYLTPDAIQDFIDIYEYIAANSGFPEVAWAYIEKLCLKCHDLKTTPLIGQQRDDLRKNLRIVAIDKTRSQLLRLLKTNKSSLFLIFFMAAEIMKRLWVVKRHIKMMS